MSFLLNSRITSGLLLLVTVFVFGKNFWLNEDAYIVFRSLEQLQAGNGAVWNAGERVQVYTSVIWYWLLAAVNTVVGDVFVTTIIVSCALFAALLALVWQRYNSSAAFWTVLLCWLLSKGFFDYTASGLENSLAFVALALLYCRYGNAQVQPIATKSFSAREQTVIAWLTGLMPLIRHDLTLIVAPAFALLLWQSRGDVRQLLQLVACAASPLLVWSFASLIYYGQPLPNTAYAKLSHGLAGEQSLRDGVTYFYSHLPRDPITLLLIALSLPVLCMPGISRWHKALVVGAWLYCAYLLKIGGDYMLGRFLGFPFLVCTLAAGDAVRQLLTRPARRTLPGMVTASMAGAGIAAACYATLVVDTPPFTPWNYGRDADAMALVQESRVSGVLNQRQLHYQTTLAAWWNNDTRAPGVLESFRRDGENLKDSTETVTVRGALGTTGYYAGLNVHIVDYFALTDPLLSHLPALRRVASGHLERSVPAGYVEHLRDPATPLADASLHRYYSIIAELTRSDTLFSWRRIKTIIAFNLGAYDALLDNYRRDVATRRATLPQQEH